MSLNFQTVKIIYLLMVSKKNKPSVSILIPAFNEEKNIEKIIKDCLKLGMYHIDVLVVIDKKTTDNTKNVAEKSGAKVMILGTGAGKGEIIKLAIPYLKGEYAVQIDADYQFLPIEIPKLVTPLIKGYDVTLGTRYQKGANLENGSVTFLKKMGSFFLSACTSYFAKQRITDVMAGFKGFKTSILKDLNPKTNHFGYEAELVIKAAKKRYKILNIPITYKKRVTGNSSVYMIKHGLLVFQTIAKTGFNY